MSLTTPSASDRRLGTAIFAATTALVVAVGLPVIWRGAPLGDDFNNCLAPLEVGLDGFFAASWDRLGMIRLARFAEILVTTGICRAMPFGAAIAVPLLLTLGVALLVRGLLRDLQLAPPWPAVGGALWLLQPLGTEAALWPAALHVPLGLACALAALRLYRRGRLASGMLFNLGAGMSVEQTLLAVPLAAWLLTPSAHRRPAAGAAASVTVVLLLMFALWPGADPRLRVGLMERLSALATDWPFYVGFPAVGLGFHSIPLAVWWALPWSVIVLATGATLGAAAARRARTGQGLARRDIASVCLAVAALMVLANAPVLWSLPHQGSPRVFAPTWLILVMSLTMLSARAQWRQRALVGAAAGVFAGGALLSQALSVSVRLASADFTEAAARLIAARVSEGGRVAVCDVRRTVVTPAPRGGFAVHELVYDWAAARSLTYYTGRRATFRLAGELWNVPCPTDADVVISFDDLLTKARQ